MTQLFTLPYLLLSYYLFHIITMKTMRILAAAATLSVGNALTQHVEERKLMSYVSYTHMSPEFFRRNLVCGLVVSIYTLLFVV